MTNSDRPSIANLSTTDIRVLLRSARWALGVTWRTHARLVVAISIVTVLLSLTPAALAIVVRGLVNAVAEVINTGVANQQMILLWLGIGLAVTLVETIGSFANDYFQQRLQDELNIKVTSDILEHAARLDLAHFENPDFQDVLERAQQGAARRFAQFVMKALMVVTSVLQMISLTVILAAIEPLVIVVLIAVAIPYLFFQWRLAKSRYMMGFQRVTKRRWTNYFVMQLTDHRWVPEVKLLDLSPLLARKFRDLMEEFRDENRQIFGRIFGGSSLFAAISSLAFYGTFVRVALRVVDGGLTIGDVAVYGGAMARLRHSLEQAILNLTGALENTLHIANLQTFLAIEPAVRPGANGVTPPPPRGEVEIRDVTFAYPAARQPVLRDISLHVRPGETVALVGRNGAGKTTLVKLIARLYEAAEGQILFDGVDVRHLPLDYLHGQIGFVFQQFGRYEATVAENIAYGKWRELLADRPRIEAVAAQAQADDMIAAMPDGYDTMLGRMFGDFNLSGGQWQRIALARAFARDASLLILDEPTSNMDAKAEYRLFARFRELAQGRTTILISHRFSTVSIADRILVMENGRIIESGSHEALMAQGGHYAELYDLHRRQMDMNSQGGS